MLRSGGSQRSHWLSSDPGKWRGVSGFFQLLSDAALWVQADVRSAVKSIESWHLAQESRKKFGDKVGYFACSHVYRAR